MTFLIFLFAMALIVLMILSNIQKPKRIIRIHHGKPPARVSKWPFTDTHSLLG